MTRIRPDYRGILRLAAKQLSQEKIACSVGSSKKTVNRILRLAKERGLSWPLPDEQTNDVLAKVFSKPPKVTQTNRYLPDFERIHRELQHAGVNKKLLWTEYLEECRLKNQLGLKYSQFCHYIQLDEERRQATMHLHHQPGEKVEVDWAGDPAFYTDRETGEKIKALVFIAVLPYSQYTFAKAYPDERQHSWLQAHIDMYRYFGGVTKLLVPDNCKTAVVHTRNWYTPKLNTAYHELAEHYDTVILPARVRHPKDKPSAEGNVGHASTWLIAALRHEQFFSLADLNAALAEKLEAYNHRPFQKRDGCRLDIFLQEERPYLAQLPIMPYEVADWKSAKVQYNYHVSVLGMYYSVPYEYIHKTVEIRITQSAVQIFYDHKRIASHLRLYGPKGQYSTCKMHMPENHRKYLEWDGARFHSWAESIGPNAVDVIDGILRTHPVEQQGYRSCMGLIHLAETYSSPGLAAKLEQSHARLEETNYTCGRRLNRRLIEKLGTCEYIERNLNVFITGATGGGKPYLACALGYEACCHDYPTAFIRLSDYLTDIALARQENTYRKILKKYTNPKLLIIDEWLLVPPNEQERREIAELIHKRRRHASTIFCSQYNDREWFDQLGGENSPLAESILDRIVHDAYRVKLEAIDPEQDISMREIYGLKDEY